MKKCVKCNEEKDDSEFYKSRTGCKSCVISYQRERYLKNPERFKSYQKNRRKEIFEQQGGFVVYYLPEHHYVGMTRNLTRRLNDHIKDGKITDGHEVVGSFKTAVEAHYVETSLHVRGYEGYNYKGNY